MKNYILIVLACSSITGLFAQSDVNKVSSTVFKEDIESHIYFLASDELKGRQTGSHELDIAAAYIANQFRKYGVKPIGDNDTYYQNIPLEHTSKPTKLLLEVNEESATKFLYVSVDNFDFDGEAIFLNFGGDDDFKKADVSGKLVVVKAGLPESSDFRSKYRQSAKKRARAQKYGAAGLVELVDDDGKMWRRYEHYINEPKVKLSDEAPGKKFVHIWALDQGSGMIAKLSTAKKLSASLSIEGVDNKKIKSKNVVGYLEGSDPQLKNEFVIYSAHYDHVGIGKPNSEMDSIYNGARDNAVGTVTVLSVAENIAKYPTKRSSLFILFTGEEKGLLGSKYYVENPVLPLQNMVYCFNSDNGGYNDTSKITIFGLYRTTVSHHIIQSAKEFGLTAIDDPAPEQNLFDRSDNVNFAAKGIPAPTYSMGFNAFDEEIYKYYHQPSDNPDTLDYDYLEKFFKSYVMASRMIANDPNTPFWTEGDKYYDNGKALYKNSKIQLNLLD